MFSSSVISTATEPSTITYFSRKDLGDAAPRILCLPLDSGSALYRREGSGSSTLSKLCKYTPPRKAIQA